MRFRGKKPLTVVFSRSVKIARRIKDLDNNYYCLTLMQRVAMLRKYFAQKEIKATGNGKAVKASTKDEDFVFLQLTDFIQEALIKCDELGLLPVISVSDTSATMTVNDVFGRFEPLVITAPTCKVESNGQELQGIGAQITYNRRYLWYLLLEICVHDALDEGAFNDATRRIIKERNAKKEVENASKITPTEAKTPTAPTATETPVVPVATPVAPTASTTEESKKPVVKKGLSESQKAEITLRIKTLRDKLPSMTKDELVQEAKRMKLNLNGDINSYDDSALRNILNRVFVRLLANNN